MPIASLWYRLGVKRPEKTSMLTTLLNPGFMEGNAIDVGGDLYIVTKITHNVDFGTSTMEVVEPGWLWKMKFRFKRFLRTTLRTLARNWRRFRADRKND